MLGSIGYRFLMFSLVCIFSWGWQETKAQVGLDFGDTETTNKNPSIAVPRKEFKQKRRLYIIKKDTKEILNGNLCFEQETRKMGFEYLVQLKGNPGYKNDFGRFVHNFGVKTVVLFRNGPFWKVKLNKKRKECRSKTADYMG